MQDGQGSVYSSSVRQAFGNIYGLQMVYGIRLFLNLSLGLLAYMFSGKPLEAWKGGRF